jgi:hypothetical protein
VIPILASSIHFSCILRVAKVEFHPLSAFLYAGVAELADAYGSGPYGGNSMKVQVLSPAPGNSKTLRGLFFMLFLLKAAIPIGRFDI